MSIHQIQIESMKFLYVSEYLLVKEKCNTRWNAYLSRSIDVLYERYLNI